MNGREPGGLRTTGDVLALDILPVTSDRLCAFLGLGAVPDCVAHELNDTAWRALAELRRRLARSMFCGESLPGAVIQAAADAVNADSLIWWPPGAIAGLRGRKRPDWNVTLSVPALWGLHAVRGSLWQRVAGKQEGPGLARLHAALAAGGVLTELLGAEIGPPYDFGRPYPRPGAVQAAWLRFAAAIARLPGLVVAMVLMPADDLAAVPAAAGNGCLAEAGGTE
jgi:hypothetical protein